MICNFCICICPALIPAAVRAGNKPHGAADSQTIKVWTNSDLDRLHDVAPVSIVGQVDQVKSTFESGTRVYEATQDPDWYARQASRLRDELKYWQIQLREYQKVLEDVQSLKETTGGINLTGGNFAITPEAGMEILQQHVTQVQKRLDDLEDLARRNDIEPGALRGQ